MNLRVPLWTFLVLLTVWVSAIELTLLIIGVDVIAGFFWIVCCVPVVLFFTGYYARHIVKIVSEILGGMGWKQ